MKRFAILRDLDPGMTWDQTDAGAVQTILNMGQGEADLDVAWEPSIMGVSWIRSYWASGTGWAVCLYGGDRLGVIERYHALCKVPYVAIDEIEEVESRSTRLGYPRGYRYPFADAPLLTIQGPPSVLASGGEWETRYRSCGAAGWLRTYLDHAHESALALYRRDSVSRDFVKQAEEAGCRFRQVVELSPADYLGWD